MPHFYTIFPAERSDQPWPTIPFSSVFGICRFMTVRWEIMGNQKAPRFQIHTIKTSPWRKMLFFIVLCWSISELYPNSMCVSPKKAPFLQWLGRIAIISVSHLVVIFQIFPTLPLHLVLSASSSFGKASRLSLGRKKHPKNERFNQRQKQLWSRVQRVLLPSSQT